jgi:DHA1 family tetracycline resistance protein-like MFS transporter
MASASSSPALGGLLGQWNLNAPAYAAGLIFLASTALIYFQLPESLPKERRTTHRLSANDFNPFASVAQMMRKPGLGLILLILALFSFSFDGVNSISGFFIKNKFDTSPLTLGLLFVFVGIATALVQGMLTERLVKQHGEKRMALIGLLASVVGWPLIMLAPALWMLFPITFVQSGITGFIWGTTGALAASYAPEHEQGQLAGVNAALAGLMSMLLYGQALYTIASRQAPYWMGSLILLIACVLWHVSRCRPRPRQSTNAFSTAD